MVFQNNMSFVWLLVVDAVFVVLSVVYYLLGRFAYNIESVPLALSFWSLSFVTPIFVGYGIYRIIEEQLLGFIDFPTLSFGEYDKLVFSFLFVVTAAFLMIMRVLLIVQSVIVFQYFGEGLANLESKSANYWVEDDVSESSENDYGTVDNLKSIRRGGDD